MNKTALLSLGVLAAFAAPLTAASIAVNNFSFEQPTLAAGAWNDGVAPGWTSTGANVNDTFTENIAGFVSAGGNHQGIVLNVSIWQELAVAWAPNTSYSLIVGIGNRNASFSVAGNSSSIYLESGAAAVGTSLAGKSLDASTLAASSFADSALTFVTGAVAPAGNIRIRLEAGGAGRSHFDNVRLDASPVPEPSAALLASGLGAMALIRRRRA